MSLIPSWFLNLERHQYIMSLAIPMIVDKLLGSLYEMYVDAPTNILPMEYKIEQPFHGADIWDKKHAAPLVYIG